jgi:hypothetical protein
MLMPGSGRLRGTAALQACTETDGLLLADPLEPGGRPLRRRRETGVQFTAGHGCEGPQPSGLAPKRWAIAGRSSGGRPLRRRREMMLMPGTGVAARDRRPPS